MLEQTALDKAMDRVTDATARVKACRLDLKAAIKELDEATKAFKREATAATRP